MVVRKPFLVLLVLASLVVPGILQAEVQVKPALSTTKLSPTANRAGLLQAALGRLRLSAQERTKMAEQFEKLSPEAQQIALASVDSGYAGQIGLKPNVIKIDSDHVALIKAPYIDHFYPETGEASSSMIVYGENFNANSKIYFDGNPLNTQLWGNNLIFIIPASITTGVDHTVRVKNTDPAGESEVATLHIVAYKGYRGLNGWKFANFTTPVLDWSLYRDYFTPAAVEYSDGTHRPAAQQWYDAVYKGVAARGDCFGMSVRSIKTKLGDWRGINASWWPNNVKNWVWDYNSCDQILDCIRQDQAGQLCRQTWGAMISRWYQKRNGNIGCDSIRDGLASNDPQRMPIMCMYQDGHYGHAVVAWMVNEGTSDTRYIHLYNNNTPYAENEAPQSEYATVSKSTGAFSYNGYNEMFPVTFAEATPGVPELPTGVAPSSTGSTGAADITVVVVEVGSEVKQITDENGRTFYTGTQENRNPATQIPNSMRFIPMCAGPRPVPLPADFPGIYLFGNSSGKSLKIDTVRPRSRTVKVFNAGKVMTLNGGSGSVTLRNLLKPEQSIEIANPATMNVQEVNIISVDQDRTERVFRVDNLNTVQQNLSIKLLPGSAGLNVSNGATTTANLGLSVQRFSNSGIQKGVASKIEIPANQQGLINVDFANLQQAPKMELRPR